jgi:hypothetical protein
VGPVRKIIETFNDVFVVGAEEGIALTLKVFYGVRALGWNLFQSDVSPI